jgi:protein transport protein SEC23
MIMIMLLRRQVDFRSKLWTCQLCTARNHFPPHYAENITETNLPAELIPQFTTLEYELPSLSPTGPPVFLLVVDTCVHEDELVHLRDSLQQTLNILPDDALVGLITFGTMVHVHELGFTSCPKAFVFRGDRDYSSSQILDMLGAMPMRAGQPVQQHTGPGMRQPAVGRFLMPVSECSFSLEQVLDDLQRDPWPCNQEDRVQRCTGVAASIAIGLLEGSVPRQGARVMMFVAGPPTVGPGAVVSRSKKEHIRSHMDLQKNQAAMHKPSSDFFRGLSDRLISSSIAVDLFACSLDQVGALEMRVLISRSGGLFVLADSFGQSVFRESLRRVFSRSADPADPSAPGSLVMGFGGQIEVQHSRDFKLCGAIGPVASLKKQGVGVSEHEVGVG